MATTRLVMFWAGGVAAAGPTAFQANSDGLGVIGGARWGLAAALWMLPVTAGVWALISTTSGHEAGMAQASLLAGTSLRVQLLADQAAAIALSIATIPYAVLGGACVGTADSLRQGSALASISTSQPAFPVAGYPAVVVVAVCMCSAVAALTRRRVLAAYATVISLMLFLLLIQTAKSIHAIAITAKLLPWAPAWDAISAGGSRHALSMSRGLALANVATWTVLALLAIAISTGARRPRYLPARF